MTQRATTSTPGTATGPPGSNAKYPTQIPLRGWWQVTRRAFAESKADHVPILAAGVAFYAFLAIFPALIAALTIYRLVADPAQVAQQAEALAAALPREAQPLIIDQLRSVMTSSDRALGVGLAISLLAALWSASSGTSSLIQAINIAYDEEDTRSAVKLRATALLLTFGAIVFVLVALTLVAVVPVLFDALPLGPVGIVLAQVLRWALLLAMVIVALAVVYRVAPDREAPRLEWASLGALVAAALWIVGSLLFSFYVDNFGRYNATYGALTGVVVLLLWLYLTSYVVLFGAEINAEAERQTRQDSTRGEPRPMGERDATAADEVAGPDGRPGNRHAEQR